MSILLKSILQHFRCCFQKNEEQKKEKQAPISPAKKEEPSPAATAPSQQHAASSRVSATPFARKLAAARGLDLGEVAGSGPNGRILAADLQGAPKKTETAGKAAGAGHSEQEYTVVLFRSTSTNSFLGLPVDKHASNDCKPSHGEQIDDSSLLLDKRDSPRQSDSVSDDSFFI